jgi:hypothetical protein
MNKNQNVRVVTIQMELAIPTDDCECLSRNEICNYLNIKLYENPEFFVMAPENIVKVGSLES